MVVRPSIMGIEPIVHGGHLRLSGYKVIHIPLIWRIRYWDDDPHLGWFWCQPCPSCQPIHCSLDIRGGQRSNDSGVGKWIRKSIRTCNACINVIYIYIYLGKLYKYIYIYIHIYIDLIICSLEPQLRFLPPCPCDLDLSLLSPRCGWCESVRPRAVWESLVTVSRSHGQAECWDEGWDRRGSKEIGTSFWGSWMDSIFSMVFSMKLWFGKFRVWQFQRTH